ncbi:C14orf1 [Bugula neritina]|uniref:C14orf1 n=1 Tax=Bugula neritina TaxID=10212 RepID=A0A7J7KPX4_BUGNE|nr:C14orf1 [Bugula neritina]
MGSSSKPKHVLVLRIWIAIVAFMALGNTFACFFGSPQFLRERLYNGKPEELSGLAARLFGCWTLLASIVRAYCSLYIYNKTLYHITLLTFVMAFLHFATELSHFGTCLLEVGVISPLIISGVSILWMFIAQYFIEFPEDTVRRSRSAKSS